MTAAEVTDLRLLLAAEAGSVAVARRAVSGFAEAAGADVGAVAVAVSEAVTNAVLHAYPDGAPGEILVEASIDGAEVMVLITDTGRGIRPNPGSAGIGYGLALVASLADELAIAGSEGGGTIVRMRFALAG